MIIDAVVLASLSLGFATGMRALHRHKDRFAEFETCDLIKLDTNAVIYCLVAFSSAFCLIDIAMQVALMVYKPILMTEWRVALAGGHINAALVFSGMHLVFDKLLEAKQEVASVPKLKVGKDA